MNDVAVRHAQPSTDTRALVQTFHDRLGAIRTQVRKIIVGQDEVVDHLLLTLLVGGHCLITGMPGTAKTLLVRTLAQALGLTFKRIQFTPDLMPTDVTGTDIIEEDITTGHRRWTFVPGPIFANVLLADEINRTPPKTQAALLEAMQEHSVTVRGTTHTLERAVLRARDAEPDRAGRHLSAAGSAARPLPVQRAARLPERRGRDGSRRSQHHAHGAAGDRRPARAPRRSCSSSGWCGRCRCRRKFAQARGELVRATRPNEPGAPEGVRRYVRYGASVRATQFLCLAAKARALMAGRYHVTEEDLRALALPVLRHRVLTNYQAESDGKTVDDVLREVIAAGERRTALNRAAAARRRSPGSRTSSWWRARPWRAFSPACIARRTSASARSSRSIAPTSKATIRASSTGTSTRAPSAPTSAATKARPTRG